MDTASLPGISQLQDEMSLLAIEKLKANFLDSFGAEFHRELVPNFKAIMDKL